jgi:small redox-active disulfide protein 2
MKIEILGVGCPRCRMLAERADEAAREMGLDFEIIKVTELKEIMAYGVMVTPALAVDGEVMVTGKVPSVDAIMNLLRRKEEE